MAAALLRFEFHLPHEESFVLTQGLWIAVFTKMIVFLMAGMDRGGWRFAGIADMMKIFYGNLGASALFTLTTYLMVGVRFPRSIYIIDWILCFVLTAGLRFAVRVHHENASKDSTRSGLKNAVIYGAGAEAATLVREIRANTSLNYNILGMLDDDPEKWGTTVNGVQVIGRGRDAALVVHRFAARGRAVDEIIIAMSSATGRQMQEALANCRSSGVAIKTIPSVGELLAGKVLTSQIRDVSVNDLLGREPVELDRTLISESIRGKTVLVTGAAGSIGSEICRQVARYQPKQIIGLERAESDLYRLELEMKDRAPEVEFVPQIGDIRDRAAMEHVIRKHSVDSIFHAAAYKHVPMMEAHVVEAIENNVFGTQVVVEAAFRCGVGSFLMISSDKAVNPTNIMGATKRVAELIVSSMGNTPANGRAPRTKFVSVRFGNVLGSNGSVVPLFKNQIAAGGPVTVTHPEIRRYFMTIPEAVELVLQASTMGHGSEIFVLDMGEPVKIVDLAKNMIRLSGREPDVDIEIRYTGLRPGEKLFEELNIDGENILPTFHQKIKIFRNGNLDSREIEEGLVRLAEALVRRDEIGAVRELARLVPEYTPDPKWTARLKSGVAIAS
jgi:FlaA1/EpsC-like NDP-sugar epimerase